MNTDGLKRAAAQHAFSLIQGERLIGVGSGSTVNCFINLLAEQSHHLDAAIPTSDETERRLKEAGIAIEDLNHVGQLPVIVDGADEFNAFGTLIKGGGGALTREKIVASASDRFICIADASKAVKRLGKFPVAVEVIPMARSCVARTLVQLGGDPHYREGATTDNGNVILDVYGLTLDEPLKMETLLNSIPGVVDNGIFAKRGADLIIKSSSHGIEEIHPKT